MFYLFGRWPAVSEETAGHSMPSRSNSHRVRRGFEVAAGEAHVELRRVLLEDRGEVRPEHLPLDGDVERVGGRDDHDALLPEDGVEREQVVPVPHPARVGGHGGVDVDVHRVGGIEREAEAVAFLERPVEDRLHQCHAGLADRLTGRGDRVRRIARHDGERFVLERAHHGLTRVENDAQHQFFLDRQAGDEEIGVPADDRNAADLLVTEEQNSVLRAVVGVDPHEGVGVAGALGHDTPVHDLHRSPAVVAGRVGTARDGHTHLADHHDDVQRQGHPCEAEVVAVHCGRQAVDGDRQVALESIAVDVAVAGDVAVTVDGSFVVGGGLALIGAFHGVDRGFARVAAGVPVAPEEREDDSATGEAVAAGVQRKGTRAAGLDGPTRRRQGASPLQCRRDVHGELVAARFGVGEVGVDDHLAVDAAGRSRLGRLPGSAGASRSQHNDACGERGSDPEGRHSRLHLLHDVSLGIEVPA